MNTSNDTIKQKIDSWFEENTDNMLRDLEKLIAIRSVKGPALEGAPYGEKSHEALTTAASLLEEKGFAVRNFQDIMIESDLGPKPPILGILAHLDIVEEGGGWETDPYKMTIKNGAIYGRGVIDNKGPAIAAMYAMCCARELCPDLKKGARLILGSGEETGFEDVTEYIRKNDLPPNVFSPDANFPVVNTEKGRFTPVFGAKWEKDGTLPRIVSIIGGKTVNIVPNSASAVIEGVSLGDAKEFCKNYSEKTGAQITVIAENDKLIITADGTATHASTPQMGNNAQTALIEMLASMPFAGSKGFGYLKSLSRLFSHGDYYGKALGIEMSDEISGELTVNFGVLNFTEYEFSGNFDSRTPACADTVDIVGITTEAMEAEGITIKKTTISTCHHTPADSQFVQTLLRIYEDHTGNAPECLITGGQTYVHDITGGVVFGCGFPGIDYRAHGANEFFKVDELVMSAKMFTQVIVDMCAK